MAKCEEGYICEVCGEDVESIQESDLYLRFVIGLVDPETLHTTRERHIRCNPVLAQFVVDAQFATVHVDGDFGKAELDPASVAERERLVTAGWRRLQELKQLDVPLLEYPLEEVREEMRERFGD